MSGRGPEHSGSRLEVAGLAASSAIVHRRAGELLQQRGRILAFDAGWLAMRDPEQQCHVPLATTGAGEPLRDSFGRPEADEGVDVPGRTRGRPPMLASAIPSACRRSARGPTTCCRRVSARGWPLPWSRRAGGTPASSACSPPIRPGRARPTAGFSRPESR